MAPASAADPAPRYAQVREILRREIRHRLQPGDRAPGDHAVQQRFSVSRVTARRAIDDLVKEGVLERRRGSGTYVCPAPIGQDLYHPSGWAAALRESGAEPVTLSTTIERIAADDRLADVLAVQPDAGIFRVTRLVGVRDLPISVIINHLPVDLAPDLESAGLTDDSMIATLRAHRHQPSRVDETVEAKPADSWLAGTLKIAVGAALLVVSGTVSTPDGRPLLWSTISSRGDRHRYCASYHDPSAGQSDVRTPHR